MDTANTGREMVNKNIALKNIHKIIIYIIDNKNT